MHPSSDCKIGVKTEQPLQDWNAPEQRSQDWYERDQPPSHLLLLHATRFTNRQRTVSYVRWQATAICTARMSREEGCCATQGWQLQHHCCTTEYSCCLDVTPWVADGRYADPTVSVGVGLVALRPVGVWTTAGCRSTGVHSSLCCSTALLPGPLGPQRARITPPKSDARRVHLHPGPAGSVDETPKHHQCILIPEANNVGPAEHSTSAAACCNFMQINAHGAHFTTAPLLVENPSPAYRQVVSCINACLDQTCY